MKTRREHLEASGTVAGFGSLGAAMSVPAPSVSHKRFKRRGRIEGAETFRRRNAEGYHLFLVGKKSAASPSRDGAAGMQRGGPVRGD